MRRHAGPAGLFHRRPARQGRVGGARTGARGASGHGHRPAVETDHDQPLARRPAQGRLAFRPAHRAGAAGRDRASCPPTCGGVGHGAGRDCRSTAPRPGARRAAHALAAARTTVLLCPRAAGAEAAWVGAAPVFAARHAGGARRPPDRARPLQPATPGRGDRNADGGLPLARCAGRNAPSARWRSPRPGATTC
jgi:hypothetical protein